MQSASAEDAPPAKMSKFVSLSDAENCDKASSKDVPFNIAELNALLEAMRRASMMIHGNNQPTAQLDKTIWVQITSHLHARGFQCRQWQQVRSKGQELMSKLLEERLKMGIRSNVPLKDDKQHAVFQHPGAPAKSTDGQSPQMTASGIRSFTLPSLTPAPHMPNDSIFQRISPERLNTSVPFVSSATNVNSCANQVELSGAMSEVSEYHRVPLQVLPDPSCTNMPIRSLGQLLAEIGQENIFPLPNYLLGSRPIDMSSFPAIPVCDPNSVSDGPISGLTNRPNSFGYFEQQQSSSQNSPLTMLHFAPMQPSPPQPPLPPVDPKASLLDVDYTQRMRIYAMKMEILQLKRTYWIRKLQKT
ncbi:hypothetical protein D915_000143 [Fasciola hepatica]|uniref:Uncharacterized protein n=1 Tax=Fasciola hepatica TaxID=6192 RepID=A0A2H1CX35_FASHE|nr:hypothetical protein D915_000143 [Fasciola hepatica]